MRKRREVLRVDCREVVVFIVKMQMGGLLKGL
jgi:hypothetical protein